MQLSLTLKQTADILGCSKVTVRQMIKSGKLHAFITHKQFGYRIPFFTLESLGIPPSTLDRLMTRAQKERSDSYRERYEAANLGEHAFKKGRLSALRTSNRLTR